MDDKVDNCSKEIPAIRLLKFIEELCGNGDDQQERLLLLGISMFTMFSESIHKLLKYDNDSTRKSLHYIVDKSFDRYLDRYLDRKTEIN